MLGIEREREREGERDLKNVIDLNVVNQFEAIDTLETQMGVKPLTKLQMRYDCSFNRIIL